MQRPYAHEYLGFDHVHFWVNNALQAATFYIIRFGFEIVAFRGLETRSRQIASYVLRQNNVTFVLSAPLEPSQTEMHAHIAKHGDGVRDVAFSVSDARSAYSEAIKRGAVSVQEPHELKDDNGVVVLASIKTYGDTIHTFVDRSKYNGIFLPGYPAYSRKDPLASITPCPGLNFIDHVVGNQPENQMTPIAEFYEKVMQWHRFWTVDDKQIHTEWSALRSIVVTDFQERVKMPINEPAPSKTKAVSQIQEYVDYYGGAGVQHIALNTDNIIHAIAQLRARGVRFLEIPSKYYDHLRDRLKSSPIKVQEDLDALQALNILIDFDDRGYLLQIFTHPVEDRPTLFFEVIQRHNNSGFGVGNFKALFESIEREQDKRGNLHRQ